MEGMEVAETTEERVVEAADALGIATSVAKALQARRTALSKLTGEELAALGIKVAEKDLGEPRKPGSLVDGNTWNVSGDVYYWTIGECERFLQQASGPVTVNVATDGGDASAALACFLKLRNYSGKVTTRAEGMMLSAGGMIFMAGDDRLMPSEGASVWMMHGLQTIYLKGAFGDKRKMAALLDNSELEELIRNMEAVDRMNVRAVSQRSGMKEEDVIKAFEADKYFDVDEALAAGIATGTYIPEKTADDGGDSAGLKGGASPAALGAVRRTGATALANQYLWR